MKKAASSAVSAGGAAPKETNAATGITRDPSLLFNRDRKCVMCEFIMEKVDELLRSDPLLNFLGTPRDFPWESVGSIYGAADTSSPSKRANRKLPVPPKPKNGATVASDVSSAKIRGISFDGLPIVPPPPTRLTPAEVRAGAGSQADAAALELEKRAQAAVLALAAAQAGTALPGANGVAKTFENGIRELAMYGGGPGALAQAMAPGGGGQNRPVLLTPVDPNGKLVPAGPITEMNKAPAAAAGAAPAKIFLETQARVTPSGTGTGTGNDHQLVAEDAELLAAAALPSSNLHATQHHAAAASGTGNAAAAVGEKEDAVVVPAYLTPEFYGMVKATGSGTGKNAALGHLAPHAHAAASAHLAAASHRFYAAPHHSAVNRAQEGEEEGEGQQAEGEDWEPVASMLLEMASFTQADDASGDESSLGDLARFRSALDEGLSAAQAAAAAASQQGEEMASGSPATALADAADPLVASALMNNNALADLAGSASGMTSAPGAHTADPNDVADAIVATVEASLPEYAIVKQHEAQRRQAKTASQAAAEAMASQQQRLAMLQHAQAQAQERFAQLSPQQQMAYMQQAQAQMAVQQQQSMVQQQQQRVSAYPRFARVHADTDADNAGENLLGTGTGALSESSLQAITGASAATERLAATLQQLQSAATTADDSIRRVFDNSPAAMLASGVPVEDVEAHYVQRMRSMATSPVANAQAGATSDAEEEELQQRFAQQRIGAHSLPSSHANAQALHDFRRSLLDMVSASDRRSPALATERALAGAAESAYYELSTLASASASGEDVISAIDDALAPIHRGPRVDAVGSNAASSSTAAGAAPRFAQAQANAQQEQKQGVAPGAPSYASHAHAESPHIAAQQAAHTAAYMPRFASSGSSASAGTAPAARNMDEEFAQAAELAVQQSIAQDRAALRQRLLAARRAQLNKRRYSGSRSASASGSSFLEVSSRTRSAGGDASASADAAAIAADLESIVADATAADAAAQSAEQSLSSGSSNANAASLINEASDAAADLSADSSSSADAAAASEVATDSSVAASTLVAATGVQDAVADALKEVDGAITDVGDAADAHRLAQAGVENPASKLGREDMLTAVSGTGTGNDRIVNALSSTDSSSSSSSSAAAAAALDSTVGAPSSSLDQILAAHAQSESSAPIDPVFQYAQEDISAADAEDASQAMVQGIRDALDPATHEALARTNAIARSRESAAVTRAANAAAEQARAAADEAAAAAGAARLDAIPASSSLGSDARFASAHADESGASASGSAATGTGQWNPLGKLMKKATKTAGNVASSVANGAQDLAHGAMDMAHGAAKMAKKAVKGTVRAAHGAVTGAVDHVTGAVGGALDHVNGMFGGHGGHHHGGGHGEGGAEGGDAGAGGAGGEEDPAAAASNALAALSASLGINVETDLPSGRPATPLVPQNSTEYAAWAGFDHAKALYPQRGKMGAREKTRRSYRIAQALRFQQLYHSLMKAFESVCKSELPPAMYSECRPMYAFAERIADWLLHGYYVDEICEKIRLCDPGFFDKEL